MLKYLGGPSAGCIITLATIVSGPSVACEIPDARILKQAILNITYPNALFVRGATWEMQQAGLLEMPNGERLLASGERLAELERAALAETLEALASLGQALHSASRQRHEISLVLVERMHWERFIPEPDQIYDASKTKCYLPCDIREQRADDLILVTSEPALHGIRDGLLPVTKAVELGLLRAYGAEEQVASFLEDFGEVGAEPLETSSRTKLEFQDPLIPNMLVSDQHAFRELPSRK